MGINCLLTGVGGQGTVLASKIISQTAMNLGKNVTTAETIGMAQRGGSVISHVRIGNDIYSPLITGATADVIIAFEPAEAVRTLPYLKKGGALIVCNKAVQPVTASLSGKGYDEKAMLEFLKENVEKLIVVDADRVIMSCTSAKVINVALIGAAVYSGALEMSYDDVLYTLKTKIPEKFLEMNLAAFNLTANNGGSLI